MNTRAAPSVGASAAPPEDARTLAFQFLQSLAAELSQGTVNLPSFPDVVIRLRKALADPNAQLTQISKLVGTEPRLAARLIQAANSAAFNPSGKQLTDLNAVITRLGLRPVQSSAMAFAVRQLSLAPALRQISKPLNALWLECISVAAIAQSAARRTRLKPEEAFLTGLMHGIGRLYLMIRSVGKSEDWVQSAHFVDMMKSWHPQIGKAILENWNFAPELCDAVGNQADLDRPLAGHPDLIDVLIVAIELSHLLRERESRKFETDEIPSFHRLGLTPAACQEVLIEAERELGSLYEALGS